MKTQILEKLNDLKAKSGKSYEAVHDALGYAASTVQRWHKGQSEPDMEQLANLVEFYGGSMEKLFAAVGKQEMTATQDIGYQGAAAMVEHYEARLQSKREQIEMLCAHHELALKKRDETYDRSVGYLKQQVEDMRAERKALQAELETQRRRADQMDAKRHNVFWGMLSAIILLLVLMGVMIVVDAPSIGMGW